MYKKVRGTETLDDVKALESEMLDRFGALPAPVKHLLYLARIRIYAKAYGIEEVKQQQQKIMPVYGVTT